MFAVRELPECGESRFSIRHRDHAIVEFTKKLRAEGAHVVIVFLTTAGDLKGIS